MYNVVRTNVKEEIKPDVNTNKVENVENSPVNQNNNKIISLDELKKQINNNETSGGQSVNPINTNLDNTNVLTLKAA